MGDATRPERRARDGVTAYLMDELDSRGYRVLVNWYWPDTPSSGSPLS
jgi:hypothetical protein